MKPLMALAAGLFFVVLLLLTVPAPACEWDSDTLAHEATGLPDVIQVITGRFERNPPLYYQMRLKRVADELRVNPKLLADYDDAGVACDRLKRDDDAIAWMQKKRTQLLRANQSVPATHDQWYRYYANIGTFRVHRWIRSGADRQYISEVKIARDDIARAIQINPDAHFGREKYQLQVMNWIIRPATDAAAQAAVQELFGIKNTISWSEASDDQEKLRRLNEVLQATPTDFDAYDQAIALCLSDIQMNAISDGLAYADAKRGVLERVDPHMQHQKYQWGTYFAGHGKLTAYRCLDAHGPYDIAGLKAARADFAKAIELAPQCDNGQLVSKMQALNSVVNSSDDFNPAREKAIPLSDYTLGSGKDFESNVKGLTGLIVLGDAWESVDIFSDLSKLMFYGGPSMKQNVAYLADLRCGELIDHGHHSLMPGAPTGEKLKEQLGLYSELVTHEQELKAVYPRLRAEAEEWQARRTVYMMARLRAGRHPDTDPTFWNGWHNYPPPSLDFSDATTAESKQRMTLWTVTGLSLLAVMGVGLMFYRRRRVSRA